MPQSICHQFSVQFLMLYQIVCFVLLSVLPIKTNYLSDADWLLKYPTNHQKGYEKVTQTTKQSTPPERALKTKLETRVRLFVLFCLTHFFVWQVGRFVSCSPNLLFPPPFRFWANSTFLHWKKSENCCGPTCPCPTSRTTSPLGSRLGWPASCPQRSPRRTPGTLLPIPSTSCTCFSSPGRGQPSDLGPTWTACQWSGHSHPEDSSWPVSGREGFHEGGPWPSVWAGSIT